MDICIVTIEHSWSNSILLDQNKKPQLEIFSFATNIQKGMAPFEALQERRLETPGWLLFRGELFENFLAEFVIGSDRQFGSFFGTTDCIVPITVRRKRQC